MPPEQLSSQTKWSSFVVKTIFMHGNFFLSSFATDGNDGHGLKPEKVKPTLSSINGTPAEKVTKIIIRVRAP